MEVERSPRGSFAAARTTPATPEPPLIRAPSMPLAERNMNGDAYPVGSLVCDMTVGLGQFYEMTKRGTLVGSGPRNTQVQINLGSMGYEIDSRGRIVLAGLGSSREEPIVIEDDSEMEEEEEEEEGEEEEEEEEEEDNVAMATDALETNEKKSEERKLCAAPSHSSTPAPLGVDFWQTLTNSDALPALDQETRVTESASLPRPPVNRATLANPPPPLRMREPPLVELFAGTSRSASPVRVTPAKFYPSAFLTFITVARQTFGYWMWVVNNHLSAGNGKQRIFETPLHFGVPADPRAKLCMFNEADQASDDLFIAGKPQGNYFFSTKHKHLLPMTVAINTVKLFSIGTTNVFLITPSRNVSRTLFHQAQAFVYPFLRHRFQAQQKNT